LKADNKRLTRRTYNLAGISINPEQFFTSIKKVIPDFTISYEPDFRLQIAESWPNSIDDKESKQDWDWEYKISLDDLAKKTV
jgi:hypothetical protein